MSTEIISLKDYRKNLSQIWKRSQSEKIQFIVMVHSKPAFKVVPVEETEMVTEFNSFDFDKLSKLGRLKIDKNINKMSDNDVGYVSDDEQAEIEELLKNPDCWEDSGYSETVKFKV